MSAETRGRPWVQLPISADDHIVRLSERGADDGELFVTCQSGRVFAVRRVARYKRAFKVREVGRQAGEQAQPPQEGPVM